MDNKPAIQKHPYDILPLENGAQLIFTPCPGTKDASLSDAISTLKHAGTSMLITLMFDDEMAKNNVQSLPTECLKHDIEWVQLPIVDDAAPAQAFENQWHVQKDKILEQLKNKGTIAVHCKGGSGRTGLVIGLILLSIGWPAEKIIKQIQQRRPNALKNSKQLNYFNSYL
ncbi:tyrosine-protein phosphatase [Psychrosphaera sp. 1_MG-2023]|uniref:phosphatase domain-containing protein n=1 Tax=Psychrosphaera sp. 1_MG-2023 TaxID=3062643 RepID=UPI0026E36F1E|nr:dual specificity protein phosphatase family protein [Psychrosphaera sp. 1_MG-2023]MDO6718036.1 tyrosine-protein phosphatase [Psychrosphaera sp. 1_MG-2023]